MKIKKQLFASLLTLALVLSFMPLLPGGQAHAIEMLEEDMQLTEYDYILSEPYTYVKDNTEIESVSSSDTSVAKAYFKGALLEVLPLKHGKAVITVKAVDGTSTTVNVTITKAYMKGWLKHAIGVGCSWYGSKKYEVRGIPGASGTLKVGKKTYKIKKLGKSGERVIKLKKVPKLKTKIVLKLKADGQTVTKKFKVKSLTYISTVTGAGKKVKVNIYNIHKGDKVILKYKGKTYTKKIKKNYDDKYTSVTFKTKKKVGKSASMSLKVINKDKKTLEKIKISLEDGLYPPYDPAEDEYEDEE